MLYFQKLCWFLSALFIILISLTMTRFSEKMLLSTRYIHGFMSNLIKKSLTDSKHAAGGTDAVSTYSQNLWKYSKKVYKMKYNGIIWTFLFMSQESKKCISNNFCITSLNSKIFLLGKLSQLTRKKQRSQWAMVFCYHNWSNILWEKIVLVRGKKLR